MKLGSEKLNNMSQKSHAGFSGGSVVSNPPANAGDPGSIPGPERSFGEGHGNPLPVFLPGKSHRQRSLAGYCPWGCKRVGCDLAAKQQQQSSHRCGV